MNEENWIKIKTTKMRKRVKKKDEENWRIEEEICISDLVILFLILQISSSVSSNSSSVALPFPEFLPLFLFSSFISFPSSSLFSSSSYPNYTTVMISSIFLDIFLLSLDAAFHSSSLFSSIPIQRSRLLLFFSFLLRLISSHSSSFLLFQFQSSFPHSLASLDLSLSSPNSPCSSSSSVKFLNFCLFFFSFLIFFSFLLFFFSYSSLSFYSLFSFSSYLSVTISSIILVISWEQCSPLPHFIHPC